MQDEWRTRFGAMRAATGLLRDILERQGEFRGELGMKLSVNPTDLSAMEHLIAEGALSPSALSRRLGLTTAATTTVIDRLVGLDHVHREPNDLDRRSIRVVPNPRSVDAAISTIEPLIVAVDGVLDRFDSAQQETITAYLADVAEVYRQHSHPMPEPTSAATAAI